MIRPATAEDFPFFATRMKLIQRLSMAGLGVVNRDAHLRMTANVAKLTRAFERDGRLIAICGFMLTHPGVASTFMYATGEMPKVAIELSRWIKTGMLDAAKSLGCHRLQALSLADDQEGDRWKREVLGWQWEARLRRYGVNGEDYAIHCRLL